MVNGPIDRITVLAMMFFTSIVPSSVLAILGLNQQTFTERVFSIIQRSIVYTFYYGYAVVVSIPRETACLIGIITVLILVFKFFKKGRHSTPSCNSHNFNVFNTMQLDSSRNYSTVQGTSGSNMVNKSIKVPDMFREGMDLNSWLIQLEIYLRCFDKSEWVDIAISYIESKVLRRVRNLNDLIQKKVSFDEFKSILIEAFTVKQKELEMNFEMLTQCRQSPKESIVSFGESVSRMVKKIFPNVSDSEDIDNVMQERFAAGLLNQRLRETVRSKMLKMRNIKKDELFKLHDLIDYAECKNSSYETSSQSDGRFVSSESDISAQPKKLQFQTQTNQKYKPNIGYNKNFNGSLNYEFNQQDTKIHSVPQHIQSEHPQHSNKVLLFEQRSRRASKQSVPLRGQAILNNTLVSYMCDSGADLSIIDERTYRLIKRHDPKTVLEEYQEGKLYSASGEIGVIGTLKLKRCLISPQQNLHNTKILVTNNMSGYQCVLGRDIINRTPELKRRFDNLRNFFNQISSGVLEVFNQEMEHRRFRKQSKNFHSGAKPSLKTESQINSIKSVSNEKTTQKTRPFRESKNSNVELFYNNNIIVNKKHTNQDRKTSDTNRRLTVKNNERQTISETDRSSASRTENEEIQTNSKRISAHSDSSKMFESFYNNNYGRTNKKSNLIASKLDDTSIIDNCLNKQRRLNSIQGNTVMMVKIKYHSAGD